MKKMLSGIVLMALAVIALVSVVSTPATPAPARSFRIAVVLPGKPGDYGISHGVFDALVAYKADKEKLGRERVELAVSEDNFVVDNAAAGIRDYASQGYDVVIAPSSAFGSPVRETARDFPRTSFVWGTTPDTFGLRNVYAFTVSAEESGYVEGVIAAKVARRTGLVLPLNVGSIAATFRGFEAGLKATDPQAEMLVNFTGAFGNLILANQAARTMADAGVRLLISQTEIQAGVATVAKERKIPFIGNNSNLAPFAPDVTYASANFAYEVALFQIFDQVRQGKLGGEMVDLSLKNGGIRILFNDRFPLPADARRAALQAIEDVKGGKVVIRR